MNSMILDELEACFGQELSLISKNLGTLESAISGMMRELGKGLLQRVVSRQPNGYEGSSMACNCGGSMRFVSHRSKNIHTVFGWVVHQVGSVALSQQDKRLETFLKSRQIPDSNSRVDRLYIAPDGTTVHEKDGWHEAKIGSIYWQDEHFRRQERYVGRFDKSETFGFRLWLEACHCGLREAKELVYIGDGAGWVRTIHDEHFTRAEFIVDWYHASKHIWDCGKVLFGEGTNATKRWVAYRCSLLWDGWTRRLLNVLKKQRKRYRSRKREAIDSLYRYICVNEQQMRYDVFRAAGYDIGSGAVEGACKHVVGKRLKQSGMIWTRAGSSATLALRIKWLNKEWEQLWSKKPLAA